MYFLVFSSGRLRRWRGKDVAAFIQRGGRIGKPGTNSDSRVCSATCHFDHRGKSQFLYGVSDGHALDERFG
jgi:hypothetical protein